MSYNIPYANLYYSTSICLKNEFYRQMLSLYFYYCILLFISLSNIIIIIPIKRQIYIHNTALKYTAIEYLLYALLICACKESGSFMLYLVEKSNIFIVQ